MTLQNDSDEVWMNTSDVAEQSKLYSGVQSEAWSQLYDIRQASKSSHQWQVSISEWDSSEVNSRCRIKKSTCWQLWESKTKYKIK